MANMETNKPILTITGSDGTGGAGVQADIKMIAALGGYAVSAVTSITVQNTLGIQDFYDLPASVVMSQVETILNDVQPDIIKIGMLRRVDVVLALAEMLRHNSHCRVIYDPVVCSARGDVLMSQDVIDEVKLSLLPLCTLVAIKRSDAFHLLGGTISKDTDITTVANMLLALGCDNVLLRDDYGLAAHTDVLVSGKDNVPSMLSSLGGNRIVADHHGRGGLLTSAIATFLGSNLGIEEAVGMAYNHVNQIAAAQMGVVGRSSELYSEFMAVLKEHCSESNDVGYYADRLNVSTRYLAQVTKRMADKTPKGVIDDYVMQQARMLLTTTDKTIQEIAFELAFSSQAHFAKFFKKTSGCSPSEYRKRNEE